MNLYIISFASKDHVLIANVYAKDHMTALAKAIKQTFKRDDGYSVDELDLINNMFVQEENTALIKNAQTAISYVKINGFVIT